MSGMNFKNLDFCSDVDCDNTRTFLRVRQLTHCSATLVITNITKEIDKSEDGLQKTRITEYLEPSKNGNDVQVKGTVSSFMSI